MYHGSGCSSTERASAASRCRRWCGSGGATCAAVIFEDICSPDRAFDPGNAVNGVLCINTHLAARIGTRRQIPGKVAGIRGNSGILMTQQSSGAACAAPNCAPCTWSTYKNAAACAACACTANVSKRRSKRKLPAPKICPPINTGLFLWANGKLFSISRCFHLCGMWASISVVKWSLWCRSCRCVS